MKNKQLFFCTKCGNILRENSWNVIHKDILCECGKRVEMKESYPNLQAQDLIMSSKLLFENCIKQDEKIQKQFILFLKKENICLENDEIQNIMYLYENNKTKFVDNDHDSFIATFDSFDSVLSKKGYSGVEIDTISSALAVSGKNKFRKPCIVMCSSAIEMLFYDFFNDTITKKFQNDGVPILKKQYSKESINKCIILANGFLNDSFFKEAERLSVSFLDDWKQLREIRNKIVHNNNYYITSDYVKKTVNLLEESIYVFSNLKSRLFF